MTSTGNGGFVSKSVEFGCSWMSSPSVWKHRKGAHQHRTSTADSPTPGVLFDTRFLDSEYAEKPVPRHVGLPRHARIRGAARPLPPPRPHRRDRPIVNRPMSPLRPSRWPRRAFAGLALLLALSLPSCRRGPLSRIPHSILLVHGFGGSGVVWEKNYGVVPYFESLGLQFGETL